MRYLFRSLQIFTSSENVATYVEIAKLAIKKHVKKNIDEEDLLILKESLGLVNFQNFVRSGQISQAAIWLLNFA